MKKLIYKDINLIQKESLTTEGYYQYQIEIENMSLMSLTLHLDLLDSKKITIKYPENEDGDDSRQFIECLVRPGEVKKVVNLVARQNWVLNYTLE